MSLLKTIPIAKAPSPSMQYRYANQVSLWKQLMQTFQTYRLATVPLVMAIVFASGFSVISAANDSLPGDRLYGVKMAAEQAQLRLTFDEDKQANLHVELAKKRLEEARRVIALSNPTQEAAALDALARQTERTFEVTSVLAASKAVSQNDTSLLDNLVALNKEKRSVLETAVKSKDANVLAATALNTKGNDINLARLVRPA
jgi:hypothetical protein